MNLRNKLFMHRLLLWAASLAVISGCRSAGARVEAGNAPMARESANALPADITPAVIAQGDSLFSAGSCQRCHGVAGAGANNGPSLIEGEWLHADGSFDRIVSVITSGVPRDSLKVATRRPMGARGGPMNLSDQQIRALAGYVWSISRAKRQ